MIRPTTSTVTTVETTTTLTPRQVSEACIRWVEAQCNNGERFKAVINVQFQCTDGALEKACVIVTIKTDA